MSEIFKAYDIRGLAPQEVDEGFAYLLGRAFVTYTKAKEVCVGNDMRETGVELKKALIQGITDQGANVIDIGLCSTPMFYFATMQYASGIMVTASHNPAEYNGFKLCREKAIPIGQGSGMDEIKELFLEHSFEEPEAKGSVTTKKGVLEEFVSFGLQELISTDRDIKIVVDCGNGMGGYTYTELIKQLPSNITIIPMYFELDGSFPNHEANPLKDETLVDLQKKILEEKADYGIAIDGDADRIFFVDEQGTILHCGHVGAMIAKSLLDKNPTGNFVYDIRNTEMFPEVVHANGGKAVETNVGHAYLKIKMRELDGVFGCERSGHFFNQEVEYTENEILLFTKFFNEFIHSGKTVSELMKEYQQYPYIPETNFKLASREEMLEVIKKVEETFAPEAKSIETYDGIKMRFGSWWFSLRPSNTEPVMRLNVEAHTQELLDEKVAQITGIICA